MKKKTETKKCAPKANAKKVVVKKAANVLLERTDKVVTKDKDSVLKFAVELFCDSLLDFSIHCVYLRCFSLL